MMLDTNYNDVIYYQSECEECSRTPFCAVCGRRPVKAKTRCGLCYDYLRRHGQERPTALDINPRRRPVPLAIRRERQLTEEAHAAKIAPAWAKLTVEQNR